MSLVVIFPVAKLSSAQAYCEFVNDPGNCPDAPFTIIRTDKWGQHVVAYLGPDGFKWNGQPFPEPEGGEALRADGVLSATVEWPEEE